MTTNYRNTLRNVMSLAWQFVRRNGITISQAMKTAWLNIKLRARFAKGIVKFYFTKVDGTTREAYGTLAPAITPSTSGSSRKVNDTIQTYYDTERAEWRCFKKANLIRIA